MPNLELIIEGHEAESAAEELVRAIDAPETALKATPLDTAPRAGDRAVDPIAVAALALSVPGAVLAVMDIADRIAKRRRASAMIETATRIRVERRVEIMAVTLEGPRALADMDADALLELADQGSAEDR